MTPTDPWEPTDPRESTDPRKSVDPWDQLPTVRTVDELEGYGTPAPAARDKVLTALHPLHREWLAASPLVLVGTSAADGSCDVSPKGDPAGIATVLDERTLVLPERPGNQRMDGFHNILGNPHVALIFLIPGRPDTLRVNGTARIVTDGPFFDDLVVKGHRPRLALLVRVAEVFFHCPKALLRSAAWRPETWQPDAAVSYVEAAKQLWRAGEAVAEVERHYAPERYAASLYAG